MMLRDKLKYQVSQHFLLRDITFMLRWKLHHTVTVNQVDAATQAFWFDYL